MKTAWRRRQRNDPSIFVRTTGIKMRSQLLLGFYRAGFVCVVLAILKLTIEGHWSWWRVLLPLWVVFGHNILYIAVGFAWLRFADDGEATIRPNDGASAYQLAAMLSFLIFADNLLGRIEGSGRPRKEDELRSGRYGRSR